MMRDMTQADSDRLAKHPLSGRAFKTLVAGNRDRVYRVSEIGPENWKKVKVLLELGFVDVRDGDVIINFTVSSLVKLGYVG